MKTRTIRVSESAYAWLKKKMQLNPTKNMSSSKIIDILIAHCDDTYDYTLLPDELRKLKKRLLEIELDLYNLSDEKEFLQRELSSHEKIQSKNNEKKPVTRDELFEEDDDNDEFEEDNENDEKPTTKETPTDHEKMMKTPLFE